MSSCYLRMHKQWSFAYLENGNKIRPSPREVLSVTSRSSAPRTSFVPRQTVNVRRGGLVSNGSNLTWVAE